MFLKRVPVFRKRMGMLPLSYGRRAEWIHSPAGRVILSVAHCFSPQQRTPMGCKQSTVSGYKRLTEEDILAIPLLFRDLANRSKTPGMKYWFDTCTIREGTMPLKMGVRSVFCPKA